MGMKRRLIKGKNLKRLLSMLLGIALTAGSLAGVPITAKASKSFPTLFYIGGVRVHSGNTVIDKEDNPAFKGSASFDINTYTLTLDNFDNSGEVFSYNNNKIISGLDVAPSENLTIKIIGTNRITTKESGSKNTYGICSMSGYDKGVEVTIKGDSKNDKLILEVGSDRECENTFGLTTDGSLIIENCSLISKSGKANSNSYGIIAGGPKTTTIDNIDIRNAYVSASANSGQKKLTDYGIWGWENINIENSIVEASAVNDISGFFGIYNNGGTINIDSESSVMAAGHVKAIFGSVKNLKNGTGWTNKEGTEGQSFIDISSTGQDLSSLKKVIFSDKSISVNEKPKTKNLTYTGQAQQLVTAGNAHGGKMYYALGENADTSPNASSFSTDIPMATEAGEYYVWFKAVGQGALTGETTPECITVKIYSPSQSAVSEESNTNQEQSSQNAKQVHTATDTTSENTQAQPNETVDKKQKSTSVSKVKAGIKSITVTWKKQAAKGVKGYEIQYSIDRNFKNDVKTVTIKKAKTTSTKIKKLKSKKKYYVRIRTYKKSGAAKVYSNWSKTKSVKVK
jgi:hypothetical protein